MSIILPTKPRLLLSRRSLLAAPALLLANRAMGQVGQIASWPPKSIVTGGGGGGPLIAHTALTTTNGNGITTSSIDTTGANLIVVGVAWYSGGGTPTVSDSQGASNNGAPTGLTQNSFSTNFGQLFYWYAPTHVGSGHTFTASGTGNFPAIFVAAFSTAVTTPLDQQGGGSVSSASSIADSASVTPGSNNEICVSMVGTAGTAHSVSGNSFVATDTVNYAGNGYGGGMAWVKQTTAAAVQPTWSWTTASAAVTCLATFKGA